MNPLRFLLWRRKRSSAVRGGRVLISAKVFQAATDNELSGRALKAILDKLKVVRRTLDCGIYTYYCTCEEFDEVPEKSHWPLYQPTIFTSSASFDGPIGVTFKRIN